jgi:superfamily I DNA/RNA helicase
VRLCTLHSSKGLDFPAVLLFLPSMPTGGSYDEKASESLARNLIYMAILRQGPREAGSREQLAFRCVLPFRTSA